MKTLDIIIRESREYVCEHWGQGEACVIFYAPLTRIDGITWIHPAWAREYTWREITLRADRVWRVSGSFWNPLGFTLIWKSETGVAQSPGEPQSPNFRGESRSPGAMEGRHP